jgi:hypothetical protein
MPDHKGVEVKTKRTLLMLALSVSAAALFIVVPSLWAHEIGRMTGGGSIFLTSGDILPGVANPTGVRVTHGFELHCAEEGQSAPEPNNLEINFKTADGAGNFHLEGLDYAACRSGVDPSPPAAPFYWFEGGGPGRFNNQPGYYAEWVFTDQGEPGTSDRIYWLFIYRIEGPQMVLYVTPTGHALTFGNHQAHRSTGSKQ